MTRPIAIFVLVASLCVVGAARAEDGQAVTITLKDHRFSPSEIHVPAGQAVNLLVTNADASAEEFEMGQLALEKVIPAGQTRPVRLRPFTPGRFPFVGEFHAVTAHGVIVSE